jgi:hypothetical protein
MAPLYSGIGPNLRGAQCPFVMQWTAPTTGIAMCQNTVDVAERFESASGYKQRAPGQAGKG